MSETNPTPHLSVVSGNPTDEELAVVVALIQAALAQRASAAAEASKRVANWHRNPGVLRGSIVPGHGQWVASSQRGLH